MLFQTLSTFAPAHVRINDATLLNVREKCYPFPPLSIGTEQNKLKIILKWIFLNKIKISRTGRLIRVLVVQTNLFTIYMTLI